MRYEYFEGRNLQYWLNRYSAGNTDLTAGEDREELLVDSIVPSEVVAISGLGAQIHTSRGSLIDFQSMTVNCIFGQNDPWVKMNQIAYLMSDRPSFHTTRLGSELYYTLPRRLRELKLAGIQHPVLSHRQCNGSDAVEHAIKAASNYSSKRSTLVSFEGSYHGQNLTAYNVSHVQQRHRFLASAPNVVFLAAPDATNRLGDDAPLSHCEDASLQKLKRIAPEVFAVIVEPIQMNNGVQPYSVAYLSGIREICSQHDICLIYDEVQTGFGWLGTLSAAEYYGIFPDIAAFGKALTAGNGPLALTISEKRFQHMEHGTASKTSGADVRALVAAHAVLDRLVGVGDRDLPPNIDPTLKIELQAGLLHTVNRTGTKLWENLERIKARCNGVVAAIKGGGLMCGLAIVDRSGQPSNPLAERIMERCFSAGLFLRTSKNSLVVKIPITTSDAQLEIGCSILEGAILEAAHE